MKRKPNAELIDKENPEWTEEGFQSSRPAAEALPDLFGPKVAAEMLSSHRKRERMNRAAPEPRGFQESAN